MKTQIYLGRSLISLLLILFFFTSAFAGSFKVVPLRLNLDAGKKTVTLIVTNNSDETTTIELEAFAWSQDENGKDVLQPTMDLIFFPRIANIEKGEEKIIRIGYEGKKTETTEKTYRLYVQELPVSEPGETAVKMALRMGIPVFIKPVKEIRSRAIDGMFLSDGAVIVKVKNSGNSHMTISRLSARGLDGEGKEVFTKEAAGWYVLAGRTRTFAVDLPKEECLKAEDIKIEAKIENVLLEGRFAVDKNLCADRPKSPEKMEGKPAASAD